MAKFRDITLAMDLSLNGPGFAVLAVEPTTNKPILLDVRSLVLTRHKLRSEKLNETYELIKTLISTYAPDHIVREKGFSKFPATTQALFSVVGVSELATLHAGVSVKPLEYTPANVKKVVTGKGKASKADVQLAVESQLQLKQGFLMNDDESDACAVGLTHLYKLKLAKKHE